jgi:hypothetical protein
MRRYARSPRGVRNPAGAAAARPRTLPRPLRPAAPGTRHGPPRRHRPRPRRPRRAHRAALAPPACPTPTRGSSVRSRPTTATGRRRWRCGWPSRPGATPRDRPGRGRPPRPPRGRRGGRDRRARVPQLPVRARYYADLVRRVVAEGDRFGRRTRPRTSASRQRRVRLRQPDRSPARRCRPLGRDGRCHRRAARGRRTHRRARVLRQRRRRADPPLRRVGRARRAGRGARREPLPGQLRDRHREELRAEHGDDLFGAAAGETRRRSPATLGPAADTGSGRWPSRRCAPTSRQTLHAMGVDYDVWFSERTGCTSRRDRRRDRGAARARPHLRGRRGAVPADRGARRRQGPRAGPLRRPPHVLRRRLRLHARQVAAGRPALFYLLGADHHGYVGRLKAAAGVPRHPGRTRSRSASGSSSTCCAAASRCGCPSAPAS